MWQDLRERNFRLHSCNNRRSRSFIKETYPQFEIEEGFTEEDMVFVNGTTETDEQLKIRVRKALDEIFESDESTCEIHISIFFCLLTQWGLMIFSDISISAHAITNRAIRDALGATWKRMPTGGAKQKYFFSLKIRTHISFPPSHS